MRFRNKWLVLGAGVFNTSRQIGFTLGLAILVAVFLGALHPRLADAQNQATAFVQQSDLPDSLKQGIIQGIATNVSSSSSEAAVSGEQQKFDLYDLVKQTGGPQVADANRSTLDQLSQQLQTVFAGAAASAFDRIFFVAALVLWVGALPALFIQRARGDPTHP
jgi:hypothetical protein